MCCCYWWYFAENATLWPHIHYASARIVTGNQVEYYYTIPFPVRIHSASRTTIAVIINPIYLPLCHISRTPNLISYGQQQQQKKPIRFGSQASHSTLQYHTKMTHNEMVIHERSFALSLMWCAYDFWILYTILRCPWLYIIIVDILRRESVMFIAELKLLHPKHSNLFAGFRKMFECR